MMTQFEQLSKQEQEAALHPLLDHLGNGDRPANGRWKDWHITPVAGGQNNLLYRATYPLGDLSIKFTVRDERDRAGREYGALLALHQAGLPIAPRPILLDRTSYPQPVVVQTWLEGQVSPAPPATEAEWTSLVHHLAAIHTITPDNTQVRLPEAVTNANSAEEGRQVVRQQVACLPLPAQPASLRRLMNQLEASQFPEWPEPLAALCRVDTNILNFIRRPGRWASVDWENSGWGDPAFDVADLMAHAAYIEVPPSRWDWVTDLYCGLANDATAPVRIQVYYKVLVAWWVARLARYLYEIPRGLDKRLVAWSDDWQVDKLSAKYDHYLSLTETLYF
jgi:aminoglycoside phosphotransferase (APT) family kinase protein